MSASSGSRLVVVHDRADRTRETVALLDLVAWLVDAGDRRVEVLLMKGGPLLTEFEALAPTTVVADLDPRSRDGRAERLAFALRRRVAGFRLRAQRLGLDRWGPGDAVYLHTILGVQVLRYLPADKPAVLCRLAEDVHPLRHPLQPHDLRLLLDQVDVFLPVTPVGADELLEEHQVASDRVRTVPELFVPADERLADRADERARLRTELGIADDALVVGSFGASDADAPDLGVILWSMVSRRNVGRPLELVWGFAKTEAGFWMEHDLRQTGLEAGTHAVKVDGALDDYLDLCDVVVLLTRVDYYPLAYLQAAVSGVPVVCFEGNGLAEVVGLSDGRNVAPYLDVVAVAERLLRLVVSDDDLEEERQAILRAVLDRHGPEAVGRRLVATIDQGGPRP